jgi:hypothetical protein
MMYKLSLLMFLTVMAYCPGRSSGDEGRHNTGDAIRRTTANIETAKKVEDGKKMENLEEKNTPKLHVSVENTGSTLVVEYKIKNETDVAIYLFNVIYDWDNNGTPVVVKNGLYACLRKDGVLHLAKQVLPLPKQKMVEVRRIPYTSKVEPGEEFSEKVEIAVPVKEYNQYFWERPNSEYEDRIAESVVFTVQFIRGSEALKVTETNIPGALQVWHPDLFGHIESINSKAYPVAVRVKKRLDEFEEF